MTDPREVAGDPRVRGVLDTLGEGVTIADGTGRIVFSNAAADHILGTGSSAGDPSSWAAHYGVFLPDGSAPFPTGDYPLVRALSGEETRDVEMLVRNPNVPDGVLISVTGRPMRGPGGEITGASVVFRDVTHVRAVEAALRSALATRDELAAFIVHDLKSPLGAILATAEVLSMEPGLEPGTLRTLEELGWAARSMNRMILDLLDLHVAESGALEVKGEAVPAGALLARLAEETAAAVRAYGLHLELAPIPRGVAVWGDQGLLTRLLLNLVDNCFKYGPRGGRIEVAARRVGEGGVRFEVADEGPGVPTELRSAIFEKFARAERDARGRAVQSRGIGLSFCRTVAEAHGGRIWVEDNHPRGARFCVELPVAGGG